MKISQQWITEFTPLIASPEEISARLSASLAEVEGYESFDRLYEGVVVGQIKELTPHPNSDTLQLVLVDIGHETLHIVCGANNISIGDFVPVATIGTHLTPQADHEDALIIEKRTIRGVESEGMLCSPRELGIADDHSGILLLNDEPHVGRGKSLDDLLRTMDIVYEIENKALTHRPDMFSHFGFARELSVMFDTKLELPEYMDSKMEAAQMHPSLKIDIQNPQLCRRYSAAIIANVTVKPSPLWLQRRLLNVGVRPINNVVDITNYVMLETGQPLHAFDQKTLHGESIIIRNATENEKLVTLDGKTRSLDTNMLVIADEQYATALAGIMGGKTTEVSENTTRLVLESANFEHYNNRKTSRTLGLTTEASLRFSKNQDPANTMIALAKAIELLKQYAKATVEEPILDVYPNQASIESIDISSNYIVNYIGDHQLVSETEIKRILRGLGMTISEKKTHLTVTPPSYRPDLRIKADIVEEIARIKGYDNIALSLPQRDLSPARLNPITAWKRRITDALTRLGLSEVYNYSFVGHELYEKCESVAALQILLKNPISPERAFMRPLLLPGIIENLAVNQKNTMHVSLFEMERRFVPQPNDLPLEEETIAIGLYSTSEQHTFGKIKGVVETFLCTLNLPEVSFDYVGEENYLTHMLDSKRRAQILVKGEVVGYLGELNAKIQNNFGFGNSVGVAELNASLLYPQTDQAQMYIPVSPHPELTIDISCVVDQSLSLDVVRHSLTQAGSERLVETQALNATNDKEKFGEHKKAVTFRLIFQSSKQTLSKNDILMDVQNVKTVLHENFGAELRS